jgi:predicted dinucleotide-binding enzyme
MSYAIIGFGKIGQALAKAFARKGIEVSVATTRDPKSFASDAAAIGSTIIPKTLAEAVKADILFLAVRFESHKEVAKALPSWKGKTIVDVTNAYGVPPEQLGGQPSSAKVVVGGLHRWKTGQGLQPFGRRHPRARSGRAWWQASRVLGERR